MQYPQYNIRQSAGRASIPIVASVQETGQADGLTNAEAFGRMQLGWRYSTLLRSVLIRRPGDDKDARRQHQPAEPERPG